MSFVRREPRLLALVGVTAVVDAIASVIRQVHMMSGVDTAIFDQAVWHYSRFEAPFSSIKAENLLGDHFHPLVAALAPLYWIWTDPRTLLIAQAVLIGASVIPVFLFAEPRLGRVGAYLISGAYAVFWGIQVGVLFEFHEVAFAPLLIALAILFADRRQWLWLWLVVVLLLGVKEDLSIFVVFLGLYLVSKRDFRQGAALAVVGIAWYELVTHVLIPHFAHGHGFQYWSYGQLGKNPPDAIWGLIKAPWKVFTVGLSPGLKASTIVELLTPFLFLSLCSRVVILLVPLLAERFLSTNPAFWGPHYHYSLSISPVLAMGAAAGLANVLRLLGARRLLSDRWRPATIVGITGLMLIGGLTFTLVGASDSALSQLTKSSFYRAPPYAAAAYRALRHVPSTASLATVDAALSHASERDQITQIGPSTVGRDQFVLVNTTNLTCCGATGNGGSYTLLSQVLHNELALVSPVYFDSGWLLAERPPSGQRVTNGVLSPMTKGTAHKAKRYALSWDASLSAAFSRWLTCTAKSRAHAPDTAACFATPDARFEGWQRLLSGLLERTLPSLQGGCAELARASLATTGKLARDVARLAPAAASTNPRSLPTVLSIVGIDLNGLDLTGPLDRFVVLCAPRA
jgi:uncharacterized membrane protein